MLLERVAQGTEIPGHERYDRIDQMKTLTAVLLLAGLAASGSVMASNIYKWVDAEGNIHYGDRPTGAAVASTTPVEQVAIASRRTDKAQVDAGVEARLERQTQRSESRTAAADAKKEAEELQAKADERARKCTTYRERLEKFTNSRRLYRVDDSGEREYLDDSQMDEARALVQKQVQDYCSS